jgi:hypothetical protein
VVRQITTVVKNGRVCGDMAGTIAEIIDFVHIEPESIKGKFLIKNVQHIYPILSGVGVKEVNKSSISRPHLPYERLATRLLSVDSSFKSLLIAGSRVFDSRINYWHPPVVFHDGLHFFNRKTILVDGEVLKFQQVIDV